MVFVFFLSGVYICFHCIIIWFFMLIWCLNDNKSESESELFWDTLPPIRWPMRSPANLWCTRWWKNDIFVLQKDFLRPPEIPFLYFNYQECMHAFLIDLCFYDVLVVCLCSGRKNVLLFVVGTYQIGNSTGKSCMWSIIKWMGHFCSLIHNSPKQW